MPAYLITLNDKDRCHCAERLHGHLAQAFDQIWRRGGRAWVVIGPRSADEIRDDLEPQACGDILVVRIGVDSAWSGFREQDADWLLEHL